jgi:vacuolar-type H+-ATPase subunit H
MSEKNFLSWVGFKSEESKSDSSAGNALERIRELEAQLADLRSRRDITTLTKEEFEILATETAMIIIKSAQHRESKAAALAQKVISDSTKTAKDAVDGAEAKARQILGGAESRGRKYIEAAESEASQTIATAENSASELINETRREALQVTQTAKRDAEAMVSEANNEVVEYRTWLSSAIAESERLYRIQTQSLQSAEQAIAQSRSKLGGAFEKLAGLQTDISANLDNSNRPQTRSFISAADVLAAQASTDLTIAVIPEVPFTPTAAIKKSVKRSSPAGGSATKGARRAPAKRK